MAFMKITNLNGSDAKMLPGFPTNFFSHDFCAGNSCNFSIHASDEEGLHIFLINSQVLFFALFLAHPTEWFYRKQVAVFPHICTVEKSVSSL